MSFRSLFALRSSLFALLLLAIAAGAPAATCVWQGGGGETTAQVDKATPGGVIEADDVFIITMNGKAVSAVAGGVTVADVTAAVTAAWNASTIPEHTTITASDDTTHISFTADTAGVPFTITATTTEDGGGGADAQTFIKAAVTTNESPYDWSDTDNWSDHDADGVGDVPVNADDVILENSDVDVRYGLDQNAVAVTSLTIKASYTGKIGLPRDSGSGYVQYLDSYLKIGATTVNIGEGPGEGSTRIKLDGDTDTTELNVYRTGPRESIEVPALLWKGLAAGGDNVLNLNRGDVGVAFFGGETANFETLRVGYVNNQTGDVKLEIGGGVTHKAGGTITQDGGRVMMRSATITANIYSGVFVLLEDATIATLNIYPNAVCNYRSNGIGGSTMVSVFGGVLDFREDARARTITNIKLYTGASVYDPLTTVTWSNNLVTVGCGLEDLRLELGKGKTFTRS